MTIEELIKELSAYPQRRKIYLATDSQGNNYAELGTIEDTGEKIITFYPAGKSSTIKKMTKPQVLAKIRRLDPNINQIETLNSLANQSGYLLITVALWYYTIHHDKRYK